LTVIICQPSIVLHAQNIQCKIIYTASVIVFLYCAFCGTTMIFNICTLLKMNYINMKKLSLPIHRHDKEAVLLWFEVRQYYLNYVMYIRYIYAQGAFVVVLLIVVVEIFGTLYHVIAEHKHWQYFFITSGGLTTTSATMIAIFLCALILYRFVSINRMQYSHIAMLDRELIYLEYSKQKKDL